MTDNNVEIIDFVENLEKFFQNGKIFISPMLTGSGIKVKIMHAASMGMPIISTSHSIKGFGKDIYKYLDVRDKPSEFAKSVINLVKDSKRRKFMSDGIFKYCKREFEIKKNQNIWKNILSKESKKNEL